MPSQRDQEHTVGLLARIEHTDDVAFGKPRIRGVGVRVSTVVAALDAGRNSRWIIDGYGITREDIDACIVYRELHPDTYDKGRFDTK